MANQNLPTVLLPILLLILFSYNALMVSAARNLLEIPNFPNVFPELPKPELPPLLTFPNLPKAELPKLPELPKPELPKLPEFPKPEIPKLPELPHFPNVPELPKPTLPTIPSLTSPQTTTP